MFLGILKDPPKVKPKRALSPFSITLKKITNYGEVNIGFNKDIIIDRVKPLVGLSYKELLKLKLFSLSIIPGRGQDAEKLGIASFQIKEVTKRKVVIKIVFEFPIYMS